MGLLMILSFTSWVVVGMAEHNIGPEELLPNNSSDSNRDMYVIHAMVYQVGILTNRTDDHEGLNATTMGNQEAITFYRNNGSTIDLSDLPEPLVTNMTAQSIIGLSPTGDAANHSADKSYIPWTTLEHLAPLQQPSHGVDSESTVVTRRNRRVPEGNEQKSSENEAEYEYSAEKHPSLKRNVSDENKTAVKIVAGTAAIPQQASVQSIGIPPLFTLNNIFSEIPVPIPNTAVVSYAKVNTLVPPI